MQYTPQLHKQINQTLCRKFTPAVTLDYVEMILNNVFAEEYDNGKQLQLTEQNALDGAKNWKQASFGGCYLCYNSQLNEMFGTDEEDGEKLLNMQAEALQAAWKEIEKALHLIHLC